MLMMATFLLLTLTAHVAMCLLANVDLRQAWNPRLFIERARRLPARLQDLFWLALAAEATFSVVGFIAALSLLAQHR